MSEGVEAGSVSGGVAGFQGPGEPSRKSAGVESEGIHPEFREQPDIPCPSAIFDIFEETHVHKRRVDRHNALTRRGFQALFFPLTGDDETPPAHDINRSPLAATARNAVCATPECHSLADDSASYLNNLDALQPPVVRQSCVTVGGRRSIRSLFCSNFMDSGAAYVTRTRDPIITNDVLYQLS